MSTIDEIKARLAQFIEEEPHIIQDAHLRPFNIHDIDLLLKEREILREALREACFCGPGEDCVRCEALAKADALWKERG